MRDESEKKIFRRELSSEGRHEELLIKLSGGSNSGTMEARREKKRQQWNRAVVQNIEFLRWRKRNERREAEGKSPENRPTVLGGSSRTEVRNKFRLDYRGSDQGSEGRLQRKALPNVSNPFVSRPLGAAVRYHLKQGMTSEAMNICRKATKSRGSTRTFLDVMFTFGKLAGLREAEQIWEMIETEPWIRNQQRRLFVEGLIRLAAVRGDNESFTKWESFMRDAGLKWSLYTYNSAMQMKIQRGDFDGVLQTKQSLDAAGIPPDDFTFEYLIEANCKRQDSKGLQLCLHEMDRSNIQPKHATKRRMMAFLEELGDISAAENLFRQVVKRGVGDDISPHMTMMRMRMREGDFAAVPQLLHEVELLQRPVTLELCNLYREACTALIKTDQHTGFQMLREITSLRIGKFCRGCPGESCDNGIQSLAMMLYQVGFEPPPPRVRDEDEQKAQEEEEMAADEGYRDMWLLDRG